MSDFHQGLDPMAQLEVEQEIRQVIRRLTEVTQDVARTAQMRGKTRHAYKVAHARAYLRIEEGGSTNAKRARGTVAEREAWATMECDEELADMEAAEALYLAARETAGNLRAQLDALRTLNANVRSVVAHDEGIGG